MCRKMLMCEQDQVAIQTDIDYNISECWVLCVPYIIFDDLRKYNKGSRF